MPGQIAEKDHIELPKNSSGTTCFVNFDARLEYRAPLGRLPLLAALGANPVPRFFAAAH